ncbi:carboxylate-amine ligase [Desulfurobacterium sp.]
MRFKPSKPYTVGLELEVQLVDSFTFELTEKAYTVFEKASERLSAVLHKEFLQSMVEIVSPPCSSSEEAVDILREAYGEVRRIGEEEGFYPILLGTHPFANPCEIRITRDRRYERLLEEFQIVLRNFLIFGLHIHVGVETEKQLWEAYNVTLKYLPLFVALSSSSPFYKGKFTGLHSYRLKVFEQLPRAGVPEQFFSTDEFEVMFNVLKNSGFVDSIKDIWWDVRPRPDFGTIELRVCDAIPDFNRIEAVADFFRLLVAWSSGKRVERFYHQVVKQNRWNAVRHGLEGMFIDSDGVENINSRIHWLVEEFDREGLLDRLGIRADNLYNILSGYPVSYRMIKAYEKGESLRKIVRFGLAE